MRHNGGMSEKLSEWVDRVTGGQSQRAIARELNNHGHQISSPSLSRHLPQGTLAPEIVVAIARIWDASPLDGLVACGLITRREVTEGVKSLELATASDRDIANEILRRLEERGTENLEPVDEGLNVPPPRLTLLNGEQVDGRLDYAADKEQPGDDPGED